MPKANVTRYAVLGLLTMQPRSGYDIKRFVESTISHFWHESYRWIYTTLDQLEADGLVTGRSEDRGERERVVYRIASKGRKALQNWLSEPPPQLRVRDELLLKILLGSGGGRGATRHIKRHQEQMRTRHAQIADMERSLTGLGFDTPTRERLGLTLDLSRRLTAAHLKWCDDALKALETPASRGRKTRQRTKTG